MYLVYIDLKVKIGIDMKMDRCESAKTEKWINTGMMK